MNRAVLTVYCAIALSTFAFGITCRDAAEAVNGEGDSAAVADVVVPILSSRIVKNFFKRSTLKGRKQFFARQTPENQALILDAILLLRLRARGTMNELEGVRLVEQLINQGGISGANIEYAVKHLMSVFAKVKSVHVKGGEIEDSLLPNGVSQLNSNGGWNRGEAILATARIIANQEVSPANQANFVKALKSRLAGEKELGADVVERKLGLDAAELLLGTNSKMLPAEKKKLQAALAELAGKFTEKGTADRARRLAQYQ